MGNRQSNDFRVIVVGAGFGGLTSAIECARQGLDVTILERADAPSPLGDAIGFAPNTSRILFRWGCGDAMWEHSARGRYFNIHDGKTGKIIFREDHAGQLARFGWTSLPGSRAFYQKTLWDLALKSGAKLRTGCKVISYTDGTETEKPYVILESGEKVSGDVILASDGINSRAKKLVLGFEEKAVSSGYAIYRGYAPADALANDPETAHLCDGAPHTWIGPDQHTIICTFGEPGKVHSMSFATVHEDTDEANESWSKPILIEEAVKSISSPDFEWDPVLLKVVSKFPNCIDWKLAWRDPLPRWASDDGRITILGDAAHPFLPSSAQGGSQALEDGVTLGICLALSDKTPDGVRLALKAFKEIRHKRAADVQMTGKTQIQKWHIKETEKEKEDNKQLGLDSARYFDHDAEFHALDSYESVVRKLTGDNSFTVDPARFQKVREVIKGDTIYANGAPEEKKRIWYGPPFEIPERDRP